MNKMLLSIFTALVFFVAVAVAQSTPQSDTSGAQGTQSSSPAASQGSTGSGASQGSTSSSGSMSQGSMGAENKGEAKGEKKLKGCIKTEGGQSVLEEKSGKTVNLTGSDVSPTTVMKSQYMARGKAALRPQPPVPQARRPRRQGKRST